MVNPLNTDESINHEIKTIDKQDTNDNVIIVNILNLV